MHVSTHAVSPAALCLLHALLWGPHAARAAEPQAPRAAQPTVLIAEDGKALLPIVVAPRASEEIVGHARTLGDYLGRITGGAFEMRRGDGTRGIAVGLPADFPALDLAGSFAANDPMRREDYLLRSHPEGLLVLGATRLGVQHAVWGLLQELGYRHFFAGDAWEVLPESPSVEIAIDRLEHPDYALRFAYYTHGTWAGTTSGSDADWIDWRTRNRLSPSLTFQTGHAYKRIIRENQAAFDAHPEYLALVDGERTGTKFCIANAGLRRLVIHWAIQQFSQSPGRASLSLEPSDGAHWCECDPCKSMGSVTDRVVALVNEVAQAVNERFADGQGPRYISFYAYNRHSPPPTLRLDPRAPVFIATWFLRPGRTMASQLKGWSAMTDGPIGIREYLSIVSRHRMLPAPPRAASPAYLAETIGDFHGRGARFYLAGTSYSFGPHGLGLYLASRMLWDIDACARVEELTEDFLEKAFGTSSEPMRRFYSMLEADRTWAYEKSPDLAANHERETPAALVGDMYRALREAKRLASSPEVHAKLDLLVLYTRYVDLYRRYYYTGLEGDERQKAFDAVVAFAHRIRYTRMIGTRTLLRKPVTSREPRVVVRLDAPALLVADVPFREPEIAAILSRGGQ